MPTFNLFSVAKKASLVLVTCAMANGALANCERVDVDKPKMLDGAKASMDEMLVTQKAIKEYVATTTEYTECMDESGVMDPKDTSAMTEAGAKSAAQAQGKLIAKYNKAVDDMQALSDSWSETMQAYKAANAK